jgi:hypothetical protein
MFLYHHEIHEDKIDRFSGAFPGAYDLSYNVLNRGLNIANSGFSMKQDFFPSYEFFIPNVITYAVVSSEDRLNGIYGFEMLAGEFPKEASEVAITDFTVLCMVLLGRDRLGEILAFADLITEQEGLPPILIQAVLSSLDSEALKEIMGLYAPMFLGEMYNFGQEQLTISGIIETDAIDKYGELILNTFTFDGNGEVALSNNIDWNDTAYVNLGMEALLTFNALYVHPSFVDGTDAFVSGIKTAVPSSRAGRLELFRWIEDNDLYPAMINVLTFITIANVLGIFTQVFAYLSILLAIIAGAAMYNYISASIAGGKSEIGILRALGARGKDVMKIFMFESGILTALILIFSAVFTVIFTNVLDSLLISQMVRIYNIPALADLTILSLTPLPFVMSAAATIVIMLAATLYPIYKMSKRRPIDIINER